MLMLHGEARPIYCVLEVYTMFTKVMYICVKHVYTIL